MIIIVILLIQNIGSCVMYMLICFMIFQINKVVTREYVKCLDPSAFGFELEHNNDSNRTRPRDSSLPSRTGHIESSGVRRSSILDIGMERNRSEIKSVIVQCETESKRDSILQANNKRITALKHIADILAKPPVDYMKMKRCQCATVPTA